MMSRDEMRALLIKIAEDDSFREYLTTQPTATIKAMFKATYDLDIEDDCFPPSGVRLPSKQDILDKLDLLADVFVTQGTFKFAVFLLTKR